MSRFPRSFSAPPAAPIVLPTEDASQWETVPPLGSHPHPDSAAAFTDEVDLTAIYQFERVVFVAVPPIFGLIAVLGLLGNLIVVVVIVSNRQLHNTTNVLIVSLAFADLLFIVICVPFTAIGYTAKLWPFGDVWCKIYQYVAQVTAYVSVYTLVLMSLDRYLAVVHPIRSIGIRTHRNASLVSVLTWFVILATNSPIIPEFQTIEYTFVDGQKRSACLNLYIFNNDSSVDPQSYYHGRLYYGCFFAFAYVVPLLLVCVLYGLMIQRLMRGVLQGGSTNAQGSVRAFSAAKSAERTRGKRRVTRLVLVVVVVFALCWLPIQLILFVQFVVLYPDEEMNHTWLVVLKIIFSCLAYMNSCVNPILYAFLSDNFRKTVRRVTGDCCSLRGGRICCWGWRGCRAAAGEGYARGRSVRQRVSGKLEGGGNGRPVDVNTTRSTGNALNEFEMDGQLRG